MSEGFKIGSFQAVPVKERPNRLAALIWGPAGCGKTTLAATAPGKKLFLNFDPDGPASVAGRDDCDVIDFSGSLNSVGHVLTNIGTQLKAGLDQYDTVIVDSLTSVADAALTAGIAKTKGATIERPSPGAYGVRNSYTLTLIKDVLRETGAKNKHCIFLAHEAAPDKNEEGVVIAITIMLGGQLPTQGPVSVSEVWAMYDNGKERLIAVRPCRSRRPMKTRMFDASKSPEFVWKYDAMTGKGDTLESWYEQWRAASYNKIKLPA